jgi:glycosyltransferase involved in cell wall biosynthesis
VNGLMTERTVDSLAAALADLAARPLDEVEAMGRAARQTIVADWTWAKRAGAYADMWLACLNVAQEAVP